MSNSPAPASRVADYFFVAGLHDSHLIPTFEYAKKYQRTSETDVLYYQQQEEAVANNGSNEESNKRETNVFEASFRKRGYSENEMPVLRSALSDDASLLGVLDHVQNVIDNFDKERDTARDNVIAVQQPSFTEKYPRSDSDKTITLENFRSKTSPSVTRSRTVASRKWRSPSDPKASAAQRHSKSADIVPLEQKPIPNIFDIKYTPTVLTKYPKTNDASNGPFPSYAAMFCFPRDVKLYCGEESPPPEQCHSYTITDENGSTLYGTCIVFYEKLSNKLKSPVNEAIQDWVKSNMDASTIEYAQHLQGKIRAEKEQLERARREQLTVGLSKEDTQQRSAEIQEIIRTSQENIGLYKELLEPVKMGISTADHVWVPKAISLLGRMPWMNLYSDWLKILLDNIVGVAGHRNAEPTIDIESAVINLIDEVPLPPPGRFEIGLTIDKRPLFFSRPPINQVPILKDFSLYPLFRALSPHLILAILETLLSEGKVVFLSQYTGMLSIACESFRYLLFPFHWQFVYIPVLPERLLTCLQAPVPYIIGFQGNMDDLEDYSPEDACIINLDSNSMHQFERSMLIPDRQRRKLQSALEQYAPLHTKCKIPYGVPLPVQNVYPKGKMILNCSRSKITDVFINPAKPRDSESSDNTSIWSHSASLISKPSGFWSSNASTRTSHESSTSSSVKQGFQYSGSSMLPNTTMHPIRQVPSIQSIQSAASNHSSSSGSHHKQQRVSIPTPALSPANTIDHQRPTNNNRRLSDQQDGMKNNKLSVFISKPKTIFQNGAEGDSMTSPRISVTSPIYNNSSFDHGYYNQIPRRVKHIEGHIMAEILPSELGRFQGYRCVCGKQVADENNKDGNMFMCCQECHLVTHHDCTDQILHPCLPGCFDEKKIHGAFIRMFAALLCNYRAGFVDSVDDKNSGASISATYDSSGKNLIFSKDKFIKHSDKDSREFLSKLANSQMFTQFITDRLLKSSQEPEILVFDEYIKLKLNRSKLKLVKEDTPFLNDQSYRVSQIIWSTAPEESLVVGQGKCKRFPTNLSFKQPL